MGLCCQQDCFDRSLRDLLAEVPEDLGADPADEHRRHLALVELRVKIANRWKEVLGVKDKIPKARYEQMVESTNATIAKLIEIHGQNIAFGLSPSEKQLSSLEPCESPAEKSAESASTRKSESSVVASTILPHEFRFLVNQKSVWSVCEAG